MAEMGEQVRDRTDALDAAGNTTAAIGKGFAIGSAALVSLSLFGGFLHNAGLDTDASASDIALTKPEIFAGLLIGAMLPYVFSAFTIKSVGKAAFGMVEQVRRQIRNDPGILAGTSEPDYRACIRISTISSLKEMIAPGLLVIYNLFRSFCHPSSSDLHLDQKFLQDSYQDPSLVEYKWLYQPQTQEEPGTTPRNTLRAELCKMTMVML